MIILFSCLVSNSFLNCLQYLGLSLFGAWVATIDAIVSFSSMSNIMVLSSPPLNMTPILQRCTWKSLVLIYLIKMQVRYAVKLD